MKSGILVAGAAVLLAAAAAFGVESAQGQTVKKQTTCPVMGGKIDTNVFADYDGKRVYFCCGACPAEFKKDPAKYIAKAEKDGVTLERTPTAAVAPAEPAAKPSGETPAAGPQPATETKPAQGRQHSAAGTGGCSR
jgi:YHS domain-containing protein